MSNSNLIKVYGEGRVKYGRRQNYINNYGESFIGTHKEAEVYFRQLHPTMSIMVRRHLIVPFL